MAACSHQISPSRRGSRHPQTDSQHKGPTPSRRCDGALPGTKRSGTTRAVPSARGLSRSLVRNRPDAQSLASVRDRQRGARRSPAKSRKPSRVPSLSAHHVRSGAALIPPCFCGVAFFGAALIPSAFHPHAGRDVLDLFNEPLPSLRRDDIHVPAS